MAVRGHFNLEEVESNIYKPEMTSSNSIECCFNLTDRTKDRDKKICDRRALHLIWGRETGVTAL